MSHTLVIPTYNRPEWVRRLVTYYAGYNLPTELLVLDSSRSETAQNNARWFGRFSPRVRHVIYPETMPVAVKLSRGLSQVNTPFVSFCADDDLVFPQGIADALQFLCDHPEHVCAHGLYLNFRLGPHELEKQALRADRERQGCTAEQHRQTEDKEKLQLHVWCEYGGPGNEAGHAGARIFRLFQNYESLFYGVFRTHDLSDIFSVTERIPTLHYQELFQSVAALIKGKVHRFSRIYAARQSCDPAEPTRDKWQTYYWFADNPGEFLAHYVNYCSDVWDFYRQHSAELRLDRAQFQKALDLSHTVYFSKGCPPPYFYSILQSLWPADGYADPGQIDLFSQLGAPPASTQIATVSGAPAREWTLGYLAHLVRVVAPGLMAVPHIAHLDRHVRRHCATPWLLHLPWRVRWVARVPAFRASYFELCRYLDGVGLD